MALTKQGSVSRGIELFTCIYIYISGKGFVQCIEVFKERINTKPDLLFDFCDGQLFKQHPLFSVDKRALQLVVYTDEVETVNPLGWEAQAM